MPTEHTDVACRRDVTTKYTDVARCQSLTTKHTIRADNAIVPAMWSTMWSQVYYAELCRSMLVPHSLSG